MIIRKEIMHIALPAVASNISTPLLGLVDTAVTGHLGSAVYIGAIALGGTVFNMLYWLFSFLRMGTSGVTAQAHGSGDIAEADRTLYRGVLIACCGGIILIAAGYAAVRPILRFMDADAATASEATEYIRICLWGAPAVLATYVFTGWSVGRQNTRIPLTTAIVINCVNIAVSIGLVYGCGWKTAGVATGTLVAQWMGCLCSFILLRRHYHPQHISPEKLMERGALKRFFGINVNIFLRTLCLIAVTVWFTHTGAINGTDVLAANAILLQLFLFFSYFTDGFAYAGEALAGKYYGASDYSSLHRVVLALMLTGAILAGVFSVVYAFTGEYILRLLTDSHNVLDVSVRYLPWAVVIPIAGFSAFMWDGIYIGLTRTRYLLYSMGGAMVIFFSVLAVAPAASANHGLWLAFTCYLGSRGVIEWCLWKRATIRPTLT
ncbi:MAG: MATE family efflux transporter [Muribaculaceae bacterium]|nr:MATE family efflux transporter [Muribaculaceae bacterium]